MTISSETGSGDESDVDRFKRQLAAQTTKIVKLQSTIAELKEGDVQSSAVQKLKQALRQAADERDEAETKMEDWRQQYFDLDTKFDALKSAPGLKGGSGGVNKKLEESIKREWKAKMDKQQPQNDAKLEKLKTKFQETLDSRNAACQKRIDDLRAKQATESKAKDTAVKKKSDDLKVKEDAIQKKLEENRAKCKELVAAAREKELEARNEASAEKRSVAETKKQLKADQIAEINKLKPAFSPVLKEKEREVSDVRAEKAKIEESFSKTKVEVDLINEANGKLMDSNSALERVIEQTRDKLNAADAELLVKEASIERLLLLRDKQKAAMQKAEDEGCAAVEKRLQKEGARWELQFKKAEDLGFKLAGQQRNNFELRCMLKNRDGEIAALKKEVVELKEATDGLEKAEQALQNEVAELREEANFVTPPSSGARHGPNPSPPAVSDETETGEATEVSGNSGGVAGDAAKEESAVPGASAEQSLAMETGSDAADLIA